MPAASASSPIEWIFADPTGESFSFRALLRPGEPTPSGVISGYQRHPQIAGDGVGGALIAWEDSRNGDFDPFVMRIAPQGGDYLTGIESHAPAGGKLAMYSAFPNPCNPSASVRFFMPQRARARLAVVDVRGTLVSTLRSGVLDAGMHEVRWNGQTGLGMPAASGVYFFALESEGRRLNQKVVLLK